MIWLIQNIKWDCDGDHPRDLDLPENILVVDNGGCGADEDFSDYMTDRISDVYGFCHNGFMLTEYVPNQVGTLPNVGMITTR